MTVIKSSGGTAGQASLAARLLLSLPGVVATVVLAAAYFSLAADLPNRVATHFDLAGNPDDSMAHSTFFWVLLNAGVLGVLVAAIAAWRGHGRFVVSGWTALGNYIAAMATVIGLWTLATQRGIGDWQEARDPLGWAAILLMGLPVGVALLTMVLARAVPLGEMAPVSGGPLLGLAPGEMVAFHRREHSTAFLLLGLALAALFAGLAWVSGGWGWAVVAVAMAGLGLVTHTYSLAVGVDGVVIRWGAWGLPTQRISLERIAAARVIEVRPTEWGGWGYRGSLRLFGKAAIVMRRGPGVRLDLRDGTVFAANVRDPEIAAGLVNDLISRQP